ncbi:MAG: hypothetical protein FJX25_19145 [Alphaproteobacteria bacterium]|nr:hypothetical protein [Alphaproteobacteria bacterium]
MKLIPQWRSALRMYSIRLLILIAALPALWDQIPMEIKAIIPLPWQPWIITFLAVATMLARLTDQRTPEERIADEVKHEVASLDDCSVDERLSDRASR